MIFLLLSFTLLAGFQDFTSFTYCRDNARGPYESQCVDLGPDGKGKVTFKRREASMVSVDIQLSPRATERFRTVLSETNHLEGAENYESPRKVADLGRKRLVLVTPSGKREASFNFSSLKEVTGLVNFFEGLVNQETLGFDMENALQFERLSIPKRLEQIENEIRANRISDPMRLLPMLEKIQNDQRIMNIARVHAGKLKTQIESRK